MFTRTLPFHRYTPLANVLRLFVILVMGCFGFGDQTPARAVPAAGVIGQLPLQWRCYPDGSLDPCHPQYNSVHFLDASRGWAVGGAGRIMRYDAGAWSIYPSPVTWDIDQVQVLSANDAWAVGGAFPLTSSSPILHWNGASWSEFNSSVTGVTYMQLHSLFMLNSGEGWAAGWGEMASGYAGPALLLHWNGDQWQRVDLGAFSSEDFSNAQVWAGAANDIWIFANSTLHWDGMQWKKVTTPGSIRRVHALSPTDIWGIGYDSSYTSQVFHWDGKQWSAQSKPALKSLSTIFMLSSTQGWIMGYRSAGWGEDTDPAVLTWNGVSWTEASLPGKVEMLSMAASDTGHVWAVGEYGTILQWNGSWKVAAGGTGFNKIVDLAMLSESDGWAVGFGGLIMRYDGRNWVDWPSPTTNDLRRVVVTAGNDIWITGEDVLLLWDVPAQEWSDHTGAFGSPQAGLQPQSQMGGGAFVYLPDYGWETAAGGMQLHYWDLGETAWKVKFYALPIQPVSIYMASPTDGWTVGYNSSPAIVYHWNGTAWTQVPFDDGGLDAPALVGFGANDVWMIGERTAHWDGTWHTWLSSYGRGFHDLDKAGPEDYYAIGHGGFAHWNAGGTTRPTLPVDCSEDSIDMLSTTEGWAVGYGCPFIHYSNYVYEDQVLLPAVLR